MFAFLNEISFYLNFWTVAEQTNIVKSSTLEEGNGLSILNVIKYITSIF